MKPLRGDIMVNPWIIDPIHITIRIILAVLLGGMIGLEREVTAHAAGLRTHILVCVGSTLVMLLSIYGFTDFVNQQHVQVDPSRLAAQVISGIGFLGAGTIIVTGRSIKGLTTAASLWVVAAIGLAVGAGSYYPAVLTCVVVFLSLWILNKAEHRFFIGKRQRTLSIRAQDQPGTLVQISNLLNLRNVDIRKMSLSDGVGLDSPFIEITLAIVIPKKKLELHVLQEIRAISGVTDVFFE
jgi:putative Mg2+ transporter-C (MgtC) family protein